MAIKLMSAVWECGPADPTLRMVLLSLADQADDKGRCFASYQHTADRCAVSRRTAVRAIKQLEDDKWLRVTRSRLADGRNKLNAYRLNVARLVVTECHHGGSDTVSPWVVTECHQGSDTVSPNPLLKQKNSNTAAVDQEIAGVFERHGISLNRTTRELAGRDYVTAAYVDEVVEYARRQGKGVALAVSLMLDGFEPPPATNGYKVNAIPAGMVLVDGILTYAVEGE